MNFLISIKKGEKITPDKGPVKPPVKGQTTSYTSLKHSEPHTVSDPNTPEAKAYSEKYWRDRNGLPIPDSELKPKPAAAYGPPKQYVHDGLNNLPIVKQWLSYGGVVVNEQGLFLLREPSGHYDNYHWTWPKGSPDDKETHTETALREVQEETGWKCEIVREKPLGSFYNKSGSRSTYYLMKATKQVGKPDQETSAIRWVNYEEAKALISQTTNQLGKLRDLTVLEYAKEALSNPETILSL